MAQRKETKKSAKVRDLKPKKDAKGGGHIYQGPRPSGGGHQLTGPNFQRPGNPNT